MKINPYDKKAVEKFKREKKKISKSIGNFEIHHIGSTAISGLGGKGIVDILIGINNWKQADEIIGKLKKIKFLHIHPKKNGRIFLSKDKSLSLSNIHIHIAIKQSKTYENLLFFKNYLRDNGKEAKNYFNLKQEWLDESRGDREKYQKLKSKYIKKIFKKI